jgi:hypothetical protein
MESNRLRRAGLVLAVSGVVLVAGMIAALAWMPWMQPPLLHILIIFVGLPLAGLISLIGLGLKVGWIARAGALWVLGLSLVALAVILGWFMAGRDLLQEEPTEDTNGFLQQE